jgi:hypothetical protein
VDLFISLDFDEQVIPTSNEAGEASHIRDLHDNSTEFRAS